LLETVFVCIACASGYLGSKSANYNAVVYLLGFSVSEFSQQSNNNYLSVYPAPKILLVLQIAD